MGQKVNPHGYRVGIIKNWDSRWFANDSTFGDTLVEDYNLRKYLKKTLFTAGIAKIEIERDDKRVRLHIHCAKPGMVIGRAGDGIEVLKKDLVKMTGKEVEISIEEVRKAELDAQLTAESVAQALERRVTFRRAMKQVIGRTMKANAKGIKVTCSGRLGGAEIARSESYSEGNVPLHTIRADIDYGFAEADTTYGKIGVKVWINHGEVLDKGLQSAIREEKREKRERRPRKDGERRERRTRDNGERRQGGNKRNERVEAPKAVNPRVRKTPKVEPQVEAVAEVVEATEE